MPMISIGDAMGRPGKLTVEMRADIAKGFVEDSVSAIMLAKEFSVCIATIYNVLKSEGVKLVRPELVLNAVCHYCGKPVHRMACEMRDYTHHYCGMDCYKRFVKEDGLRKAKEFIKDCKERIRDEVERNGG